MRIASAIIGLIFMLIGVIAIIGSVSKNSSNADTNSWTCIAVTSSMTQDCHFTGDSPQDVTSSTAQATQGVLIGVGALIAGAALIGGATAATRAKTYGYPGRPAGYPPRPVSRRPAIPAADLVERASDDGATAICGDASRTDVLREVVIERAARVVIATERDDTTVLIALTVRQLNKHAILSASVRSAENAPLLRSAGADAVVVSAEAAGRLLGISAESPATADVVADLLDAHNGLELLERDADERDTGRSLPPIRTRCSPSSATVG